eukprot:TRINITY_DN6039_c0_g1_i2.p1 TRINITY_DN6039_c0_g1~~TRINITY_DN6039_c0_g1_i2.p1  ORF type:complete len:765 (+),score=108.41 TRINITY_DN6039_c0_g1_i2:188-2296(+)
MQVAHCFAHDAEALRRARQRNPLREGGLVMRGAERLPLLNNVVQRMHSVRGNSEGLERARELNPLGHNGFITRLGEHIPGLADTICCIHSFTGHSVEAERARAFSLQRMVGRRGAITKLAELLPGTHLVAAALAELKGDREEALRALNLIRQWKDAAGADGALARFAELIPGLDIIQFGLRVNAGQYAHAVRAICKTRWVLITARSSALVMATGKLGELEILEVESDLQVEPKAASLAGGLVDLCIHLLHFDGNGQQRWIQRGGHNRMNPFASPKCDKDSLGIGSQMQFGRNLVQGKKIARANKELRTILDYVTETAPDYVRWLVELTNWSVLEWEPESRSSRRIMQVLSVLFPPMSFKPPPSSAPSAAFAKAFQDSISAVSIRHRCMPVSPHTFHVAPRQPHKAELRNGAPEVAATVSCLSCFAWLGCGLHLAGVAACMAGCTAAVGAIKRSVKHNFIPWLNKSNAKIWEWMSAPTTPLSMQQEMAEAQARNGLSAHVVNDVSCSSFFSINSCEESEDEDRDQAKGIIFDWSQELFEELQLSEKLRDYILYEFLSVRRMWNWCYPAVWIFQLFECKLRSFMDNAVDGQTVPVVIPIPLAAGKYESGLWLPEIKVMLVLWVRFTDHRYVAAVSVAVVDGILDDVANSLKQQLMPADLRTADPRLADFTEPIETDFKIALKWTAEDRLRVELRDLLVKLQLPL